MLPRGTIVVRQVDSDMSASLRQSYVALPGRERHRLDYTPSITYSATGINREFLTNSFRPESDLGLDKIEGDLVQTTGRPISFRFKFKVV
jgi:hypothetical protein